MSVFPLIQYFKINYPLNHSLVAYKIMKNYDHNSLDHIYEYYFNVVSTKGWDLNVNTYLL